MFQRERIKKAILFVFMLLVGIIMIIPLVWMISTSFKNEADVFNTPIEWIPNPVTLYNYERVLTDFPFVTWIFNTVWSTSWIVLVILLFGSLSGYAFAKLDFKGKGIIFLLFVSTMMIPIEVRLIPQFQMYQAMGIINTWLTLVLPWSFCAFAVFLMRQFFMSIPEELLEAARIDGAREAHIFFKIAFPLARPQLAALGILAFTWGWNQYLSALIYIRDIDKQILAVGIALLKDNMAENYGMQMAGATIALLPIIILYLILQKQFIEGVALSGVKG